MPPDDPLIAQVRDVQTRILTENKKLDEAYQVAATAAAARDAEPTDYSRLGDVLQAMKRPAAAADAYGRAIALAQAQNQQSELWTLMLLRANALEDATAGPRPSRRSSRRWRLRPISRCCSTSSAMPSSSAARTWNRPRR